MYHALSMKMVYAYLILTGDHSLLLSAKKRIVMAKFQMLHLISLSQSALQAIFAILSSYFNYLEQEEYTFGNPSCANSPKK